MREEVLLLSPSAEKGKVGFLLSKSDEPVFNISKKFVAPDVVYVKRSSYAAGSRRLQKLEEEVKASEVVSAKTRETEVLRREDLSTAQPLGLEKHERFDGEVFSQPMMSNLVSLPGELAQKEWLQGASPLQWGSLKRRRSSRGPNNQPTPCTSVDESLMSKNAVSRKRDHSCSPPAITTEHADLEEVCQMEKRLRSTDGERGMSVLKGPRGSLQAPQKLHERDFLPITRSSLGKKFASLDSQPAALTDGFKAGPDRKDFALSKFVIALSRKEMEEDFLILKGSKVFKRPKRRPKAVEKALQYCTPGNWLSDVSHTRYDVREKKCVKEKPRGLKAMESINTDSE